MSKQGQTMRTPQTQELFPPRSLLVLLLSYFFYISPTLLPALFHAGAKLLIPAELISIGLAGSSAVRTAENFFALVFFGILYNRIPQEHKKQVYPAVLRIRHSAHRFFICLGIITVCGLLAVILNLLTLQLTKGTNPIRSTSVIGIHGNAGSVGNPGETVCSAGTVGSVGTDPSHTANILPPEVYAAWFSAVLIILSTAMAAFKEELIYRAVSGVILAYLFGLQPAFAQIQAESPAKGVGEPPLKRTMLQKLLKLATLFAFSMPFALAHQGFGTIASSFILGINFLYLVLRGWSWKTLATAHTVYNLVVITARHVLALAARHISA